MNKNFRNEEQIKLSLQRLETVLVENGLMGVLKKAPDGKPFHERLLKPPSLFKKVDSIPGEDVFQVREPKAVCFCEISIEHLKTHMEKYGGVGLGFHRRSLMDKIKSLRPVYYFPIREINDVHVAEKENLLKIVGSQITLFDYVKIPTQINENENENTDSSELFEQIYEEREWRIPEDLKFSRSDLAFVVLPNQELISNYKKIKRLSESGVGIIYTDLLFEGQYNE